MTRRPPMTWVWVGLAGVSLGALAAAVPRLIDREPPELTLESWVDPDSVAAHLTQGMVSHLGEAPDHPVHGVIQALFVAHDAGSGVRMIVRVDGAPLVSGPMKEEVAFSVEIDTGGLSEGEHVIDVEIVDRSFWGNRVALRRTIVVDRTPPALTLARSARAAAQGRTAAIFVRGSEPLARVRGELGAQTLRFEALEGGVTWRALTGIPVGHPPGATALILHGVDPSGHVVTLQDQVEVSATDFPQGGIVTLSPDKQKDMLDKELTDESNRKRRAAYATPVDLPVPSAVFSMPVEGRVSSPFGKVRRYNTGIERHHLGTDLAAPSGTPVRSAAPGKVLLAELLHIYGNSVIVAHADGVSTSYSHLLQVDVAAGDMVAQGDLVGLVGSTGQSTGPHLHWGMVVDGHAVAAEQWTTERFDAPRPGDFGEDD